MCRILTYLGKKILIQDLLYKPNNSLITQSYNPKYMATSMLNLAGFGFAAWNDDSQSAHLPFLYRTPTLPFYDENLRNLASKISSQCLMAHIRGIEYSEKSIVSYQNVHPFKFKDTPLAFVHNGTLVGFQEMRFDLLKQIKPALRTFIKGTTDSETMYALFLSQFNNPYEMHSVSEIFDALSETFLILKRIRKRHQIKISSPLNFAISNGQVIVATRFVFDYGHYPSVNYTSPHMSYHSLWYTFGEEYHYFEGNYQMKTSQKMNSIIIASEPLTEDSTTWLEVPEYSFIGSTLNKQGSIEIQSRDVLG